VLLSCIDAAESDYKLKETLLVALCNVARRGTVGALALLDMNLVHIVKEFFVIEPDRRVRAQCISLLVSVAFFLAVVRVCL
jgi:hypothetical protein